MNAYDGPPMTLGNSASAHVRLIVWCLDCGHMAERDFRGPSPQRPLFHHRSK
jgi:hypothetical protein